VVAMVVDALGVRLTANAAALHEHTATAKFFWLDVFGGSEILRTELLRGLRLENSDITWALRFGQSGRMYIGREKLRVVTWMADQAGTLSEIHILCWPRCILTVWQGDAAALDEIRQQFGERAAGLEKSPYAAAGILLQLLIGTLDHSVRSLDSSLDELRIQLDKDPNGAGFAVLTRRLQSLQTIMASFNRYSSAVRAAIVGIEAVPGMDDRGAEELNDYAEQVEDVEQQIYERRRWMSDIMHDHAAAIAQRQAEQINRLTLVSVIFLPVTALSGFFGMNFNWMIGHLDSEEAFIVFGILLPILSVVVSVAYFRSRGLIQFRSRARATVAPSAGPEDLAWPLVRRAAPSPDTIVSQFTTAVPPSPDQKVNQVSL
jgi:Mg2+ and Co2+ transporter CorA